MKIFLINLKDASERRKRMVAHFSEFGVNYEIFEAIDGRKEKHPLFERYNDKRRKSYRGLALSDGELGCWTSHYLLWEKCIELDEPIVVMEDDIFLDENFLENMNFCESLLPKLKYIRLMAMKERKYDLIYSHGKFDVIRYKRGPFGAACYMISPEVAKIFVENSNEWFLAVDDYIDRFWQHGVEIYGVKPFSVNLGDIPSEMPRFQKQKKSPLGIVRREIFRLLEQLRRNLYKKSDKKEIAEKLRVLLNDR